MESETRRWLQTENSQRLPRQGIFLSRLLFPFIGSSKTCRTSQARESTTRRSACGPHARSEPAPPACPAEQDRGRTPPTGSPQQSDPARHEVEGAAFLLWQ